MPYRLREKMSDAHYFDLVDELIIKWCESHFDTPCDECKDRDMTSVLCDECSIWKCRNGKEEARFPLHIKSELKENTDEPTQ